MLKTLTLVAALAFAASAFAQPPGNEPRSYAGALVSTAADSVTLKDKDGKLVTVAMAKGWNVVAARPVPQEALQVGDFIGSANQMVDEATGRSTEIRIYEPGNQPEFGTHAMGRAPTLMTHGVVSKITPTATGRELDIAYPGGGRHLLLPAEIKPVGSFLLGVDKAQPGLVVTAVTRVGPDGVWRATRLLTSGN